MPCRAGRKQGKAATCRLLVIKKKKIGGCQTGSEQLLSSKRIG